MRLDVVLPAHNEQDRIEPMLDTYRSRLPGPEVRFIAALDGCTDATAATVERHAAEDPRVEVLDLPRLGKGGVLMEAFRRCDGDLIGFTDADGATPPSEFLRLASVAERADGAIASRRLPAAVLPAPRPAGRRMTSAAFAAAVRGLFGLRYADTQCGAKVLRRDALHRLLPFLTTRDLAFDVDLLVTARALGVRIVEVPTIWIDQEGSRVSAARDARRMGASLLSLWLRQRAVPRPRVHAPDRPATGEAMTTRRERRRAAA
jgi:glycosyltransferase involved in cell wall biosynthesis